MYGKDGDYWDNLRENGYIFEDSICKFENYEIHIAEGPKI